MSNGPIENYEGEIPPELCMYDRRSNFEGQCFCEHECERSARGYEVEEEDE